jgi:hypothetical protein
MQYLVQMLAKQYVSVCGNITAACMQRGSTQQQADTREACSSDGMCTSSAVDFVLVALLLAARKQLCCVAAL